MKTMSMVRGSVMALVLTVAGSAAARSDASGTICVPEPGNISAVVCTIGGGGGPSTFLGAFAMSGGGWVEFYSDDDGEWWVEHNSNGTTSVGWDAGGYGNYINGPNLSFGSKEGSYANKSKPSLKGKVTTGPKRSFAAAKAAAATKTGTLTSMVVPTTTYEGASIDLSLGGSGQCKASISVHKNGEFVSSTGIVPVSFPSKRTISLSQGAGEYTVTLNGKDGCVGQSKTAKIQVNKRLKFGALITKK